MPCSSSRAHCLTAVTQGWQLDVPTQVTKVEHVTLFEQAEFVDLCEQRAQGSAVLATLCWRMAKRLTEDRAGGASAQIPGGVTVNQGGATNTNTMTGPTIHVMNIMPEQGQWGAPMQPSKKAGSAAGRPSSGLGQQSLPALFGQPVSFVGLGDLEVLGRAKWSPIESGGHSSTSAISNFRNKFIADYIRDHPTLSFSDKNVEKMVKAKSYEVYIAQSKAKENPEETPATGRGSPAAAESDVFKRLPSAAGVQGVMGKDGVMDIERVGDFGDYEYYPDGGDNNSDPPSSESGKKRGPSATASEPALAKKPVTAKKSAAKLKPVAAKPAEKPAAAKLVEKPAASNKVLDLTTTRGMEEEVPQASAAEKAAEAVQGRKRSLREEEDEGDDDDEVDESSSQGDVDLVREAVNPYRKPSSGFTVNQLKVDADCFACFVGLILCIVKAWLAGRKLVQTGNKKQLTDRVGAELRKEQEKLVEEANRNPIPRNPAQKKSARHAMAEFEQPDDIDVGDILIYASKRQNGEISINDKFGLFVVKVTEVEPTQELRAEKGETDPPKVTFELELEEETQTLSVDWDAFYNIPDRLSDSYDPSTLVLFQRTCNRDSEEVLSSQLEVGWLVGRFKVGDHGDRPVLVKSVDGDNLTDHQHILFDAFGRKKFVNDVEIKMTLLEIEYSTTRSNVLPDDAGSE